MLLTHCWHVPGRHCERVLLPLTTREVFTTLLHFHHRAMALHRRWDGALLPLRVAVGHVCLRHLPSGAAQEPAHWPPHTSCGQDMCTAAEVPAQRPRRQHSGQGASTTAKAPAQWPRRQHNGQGASTTAKAPALRPRRQHNGCMLCFICNTCCIATKLCL
jgi:hypothetical protein